MHPDGSVVLLPKRPAAILRGIVKSRRQQRPVSLDEMDEASAQTAISTTRRRRHPDRAPTC